MRQFFTFRFNNLFSCHLLTTTNTEIHCRACITQENLQDIFKGKNVKGEQKIVKKKNKAKNMSWNLNTTPVNLHW